MVTRPPYRRPACPAKGTLRLSAPFRHGAPFAKQNRRSAFFVTLHKNDDTFFYTETCKIILLGDIQTVFQRAILFL